eukprot:NODE_890_length_3403_cov_0.243039.p1 type:complete len:351 gc:universal NODE_890_length_3403_cov_0.243039:1721-2773(+)
MDFQDSNKFAIICVGLPGTGKSFISRKIEQYLNFYSIKTQSFNVGDYRRQILGNAISNDYFDPLNQEYFEKRWSFAKQALNDMIEYIKVNGDVGIFDTTVTTIPQYRKLVADELTDNKIKFVYLEVICEDDEIIEKNIREVKILSQDYIGLNVDDVVDDFKKRIENHKPYYDKLDGTETAPFIQVFNNGKLSNNVGEYIVLNKIKGYLETKIVYFLMNIQTTPKKIYLMSPGESKSTLKEDADLSMAGENYAKLLTTKLLNVSDHAQRNKSLSVFCAPRAYSLETVKYFPDEILVYEKAELIEMHPGEYTGLSQDEIAIKYPDQYKLFEKDRFYHRYPRGEVSIFNLVLS